MIAPRLVSLTRVLNAELRGEDRVIRSVGTDSRKPFESGGLFVALTGERFDGHEFAAGAVARGAEALLVSRALDLGVPQLIVPDTRIALGQLGAWWRQASPARVVGVTGSNGKTTLKEMLAAILGLNARVLATQGNLNNDIGLPLTLARLQDEAFAVIEMGANHPGEIAYLSRLTQPDVAVLNNVGRAHLEGFGDLPGVANAKAEIIQGLADDGVFVHPADSEFAGLWARMAGDKRRLTFGAQAPADVHGSPDGYRIQWSPDGFRSSFPVWTRQGTIEIELALAGEHNRRNALAAIAAALALGIDLAQIRAGLAGLRPYPGRLSPRRAANGLRVIDDSYNANPDSVVAAVEVLKTAPARQVLVLGDLAELGDDAEALHGEIGREVAASGVHALYACGELSRATVAAFGSGGRHYASQSDLLDALRQDLASDDVVLVKGSRSAAMDRVVTALLEDSSC